MATLDLLIDGIEPALSVRRFDIRERIADLFTISIEARSPRPDIDLDDVVMMPASFSIMAGLAFVHGGGSRRYTGLCESIEQTQAEPSGLSTYTVKIVPRLWLLTLRQGYRIFQYLAVPDIVARVLDEFGVAHQWLIDRAAHPKLDYKVQYGESDYAFVCRLCEEAGITFTLEHDEERGTVMVLSDAPTTRPPREGLLPYVDNPNQAAEREYVTRVRTRRRGQAGAVMLRDYDFRHPSFGLFAAVPTASAAERRLSQCHYEPGSFRAVVEAKTSTPIADAAGVVRHDPSYGLARAERMLLGARASTRVLTFETNAMDLAPGAVFSITGHPHPSLPDSAKLLVTGLALSGEHDKEWTAKGQAVFTDTPYWPAQKTPKPVVHGLQSAIVTGPEGREVFTDEHGRVRVQFPWDCEAKGDEKSSCWIRVSQGWSGAGFGLWTLPRVGQEVLVGFLAGDPDEPIIVGRAGNVRNPPPYSLPAHETRTVWRSQSTPGGNGFNEISFEDKRGEERLYERAEKDKESLIRNDERVVVGHNRQKLVRRDEDVATLGTRRELIGGSLHLTIRGERRDEVDGSRSEVVGGDHNECIGGRYAIAAGSEIHLVASGRIVLEAPDITLKSGGGFVHVGSTGVEIDGASVLIKQGGLPGSGAGSHPKEPEQPVMPAAFLAGPPNAVRHLPLLALHPVLPLNIVPGVESVVICQAICTCKDVRSANGRRAAQACATTQLRAYDAALGGQSTIKAEVPYDMSKSPPAPIMSKNHPGPTTGHPKASRIPDVVVLIDGTKPPMQGNIQKVIEIKFPPDTLSRAQADEYLEIAGPAPFEVWGPVNPCNCDEGVKDPIPVPVTKPDMIEIAVLLAAIAILLADDLLPGGQADDVLLPGVISRLLQNLAPLLFPVIP
jgi:type VI secretion system secreted protein VgrG